jgi:hypothetical protein
LPEHKSGKSAESKYDNFAIALSGAGDKELCVILTHTGIVWPLLLLTRAMPLNHFVPQRKSL